MCGMELMRRGGRLGQAGEGGVFRAEDFYEEAWVAAVCDTSAVDVLRPLATYLAHTEGAWAQVACAKHMLECVSAMGVDLEAGAPEGSLTLLYEAYLSLVQRWYMEWERGGMAAPGGYEACLDGRCWLVWSAPVAAGVEAGGCMCLDGDAAATGRPYALLLSGVPPCSAHSLLLSGVQARRLPAGARPLYGGA